MALPIRKIQTSVSKEIQVNMLIYSMGEEADGIVYAFGLSENDRKKYNTSPMITLLSEETLSTNEEV